MKFYVRGKSEIFNYSFDCESEKECKQLLQRFLNMDDEPKEFEKLLIDEKIIFYTEEEYDEEFK